MWLPRADHRPEKNTNRPRKEYVSKFINYVADYADVSDPVWSAVEQYCLARAPHRLTRNTTMSDAAVDQILGVGARAKWPIAGIVVNVLETRVLTDAQRATVLARERRAGPLLALLRNQRITRAELEQLCSRQIGSGPAAFVVEHHESFGLVHEEELLVRLAEQSLDSIRVRLLTSGGVGTYAAHATRWVTQYMNSIDRGGFAADSISTLRRLVHTRPDVLDAVTSSTLPVYHAERLGSVLASGDVLTEFAQQIRVAGLEGLTELPAGASDAERAERETRLRHWLSRVRRSSADSGTMYALVNNPFTHFETVRAIQRAAIEATTAEARVQPSLFAAITERHQLASRGLYEVTVPIAQVTDPGQLAWIAQWMTTWVLNHPTRALGTRLTDNPNVNDPSVTARITRSAWYRSLENIVVTTTVPPSPSNRDCCDGTHVSGDPCEHRVCVVCPSRDEIRNTPFRNWPHVASVVLSEDAKCAVVRSTIDMAGSDVRTYELIDALAADWDGTVGELLDTAAALCQTP